MTGEASRREGLGLSPFQNIHYSHLNILKNVPEIPIHVLTWARAKRMQEVLTSLPESCLQFETDSPDLPVEFADGLRAQRNESHYLKNVFLKASLLRLLPIQSLEENNFRNLMSLKSVH